MFDSLSDQMKHDADLATTTTKRIIQWVVVILLSVLLFGGLYMGIRMLE